MGRDDRGACDDRPVLRGVGGFDREDRAGEGEEGVEGGDRIPLLRPVPGSLQDDERGEDEGCDHDGDVDEGTPTPTRTAPTVHPDALEWKRNLQQAGGAHHTLQRRLIGLRQRGQWPGATPLCTNPCGQLPV